MTVPAEITLLKHKVDVNTLEHMAARTLGTEVVTQILFNPRVLAMVASILLAFALLPFEFDRRDRNEQGPGKLSARSDAGLRDRFLGGELCEIIDTPGTNGLTPQSNDERVARDIAAFFAALSPG